MASRRGALLVNLGTPAAPTPKAIRAFLRKFLDDHRIIDLPSAVRWLLLNLIILPRRPRRLAPAYQKIWTDRGSPLWAHSQDFLAALRVELGSGFPVELGFLAGEPSVETALGNLARSGVDEVVVLSLFPQDGAATFGGVLERVYRSAAQSWDVARLRVVPPYYDDRLFLDAWTEVARPALAELRADHVLFSFHGYPERFLKRSDPTGAHCLASPSCCDVIGPRNAHCYRAQAFFDARALTERLGLDPARTSVSFQSRFGRAVWTQPYTEEVLAELPRKGVRKLAVVSPAFVADSLETLEELAIRGAEIFVAAGGEKLSLVPSLNAHPAWVKAAAALLQR